MANDELNNLPRPITVPLDFLDTVSRQPVQPPIDPQAYQDKLNAQNAQDNLPSFFKQSMDEMAQRHAAAAAQQQAEQAAREQATAVNDAANQVAIAAASEATPSDNSGASAVSGVAPEAATTNAAGVPYFLQKPEAAPPVTEANLTDTTKLLDPNLDPAERAAILARQNPDLAAQTQAKFAETVPAGETPDTGGNYKMPDAGFSNIPSEVSGALGKVMNPLGEASQKIVESTPIGMAAKLAAEQLPDTVSVAGHDVPVGDLAQGAEKMIAQAPGYVGADILTGGALLPVFGAQAVAQLATIAQQYNSGRISGFDAIKQALMVAPNLTPFLFHGSGKLADFAKTEDGQQAIRDVTGEARDNTPATNSIGSEAPKPAGEAPAVPLVPAPEITERAPTPADTAVDRHTLTTPAGDRLEYRGTHINDVTVIEQGKGTGSAMLDDAIARIKNAHPGEPITADLNSEGGAKLFARQPGAEFTDRGGNPITAEAAAVAAGKGEGPSVTITPEPAPVVPTTAPRPMTPMVAAGERGAVGNVWRTMPDDALNKPVYDSTKGAIEERARRASEAGGVPETAQPAPATSVPETAQQQLAIPETQEHGSTPPIPQEPTAPLQTVSDVTPNADNEALAASVAPAANAAPPVRPPTADVIPPAENGKPVVNGPDIPKKMTGTQKIVRYIVRALGGEFDPPAIVEAKTRAARSYQAAMQDASQTGKKFTEWAKQVDEPQLETTADPRQEEAWNKMNKTEKIMTAAMYPDLVKVTPAAQELIDALNAKRDWIISEGEKVGIRYGTKASETEVEPKLDAQGNEVLDANGDPVMQPKQVPNMKPAKVGTGGGSTLEYGNDYLDPDMKGRVVRASDRTNVGKIVSVNEDTQTAKVRFVNNENGTHAVVKLPASKLAVFAEDATGTSDPSWMPRKTATVTNSEGVEVPVDKVSSSLKGRTAGDIFDYVLGGNHVHDDIGLNIGGALEDTASARLTAEIRQGFQGLKDIGGNKGPATVYARPGTPKAEGYVEVPGFSADRNIHNGKMTLAQKGLVAESARNAFSKGLPDAQRTLTQPARLVRAINFSLGPFHAIYENIALAADNIKALPKTLGEEVVGTFDKSKRADMIKQANPEIMLSQQLGAQVNFGGDLRGANRAELSAVQGIPETEHIIDKIPVAGNLAAANRDWMFNWVVPWVQTRMGMTRLSSWMIDHPNLVPEDYADVMAQNDPAAIKTMLDANPKFKAAGEQIMARTNHVTGFTENTLGRAEKEVQGGILSTPTITRAIAANIRDAFSAPGTLRGTMARQYWRNAVAGMSTAAVGGTIMAFGGDVDAAKKAGYLDPQSTKFILNPNSGANFMSIVTPEGTRYRIIPSPLLSPITALMKGASTSGTTAVEGGSPMEIFSSGLGDSATAGRDFLTNRLAAPERAGKEFAEQFHQGKGFQESAKEAVLKSGESDVPLPAGELAKDVLGGNLPDRGTLEKGLMTTGGGAQYGPTASTQLDNYLKTVKNADGTPRFPDGSTTVKAGTADNYGLNQFLNEDPTASKLRDAAEAARTGTSAQSTALTQDMRNKIATEQATFNAAPVGPDKFKNFRMAVTKIRAEEGQKQADLQLSSLPSDSPDRQLISSWADTFKQARDPSTGALDSQVLDELQSQWKAAHPDDYARLIEPNYVGNSQSTTEGQLRTDRNFISDSGWWNVGTQAWDAILAKSGSTPIGAQLAQYPTFADYAKAKITEYTQHFIDKGYSDSEASSLASLIWSKDPAASLYSQVKYVKQLQLEKANPKLVATLGKWGYSSTNPTEAGLLIQDANLTPAQ